MNQRFPQVNQKWIAFSRRILNLNLPLGLLKSRLFRHSRESGNPELLEKPGFRVALHLPGTTISF
jgi:hypothetical protein